MNFNIGDDNKEIIGDIVNDLKDIWEEYERPEIDNDSPTTETYIDNPYLTEYEDIESKMWVDCYNDFVDILFGFIDLTNIANSRTSPIWYTRNEHDEKWYSYEVYDANNETEYRNGYFNDAFENIMSILECLHDRVCKLSEEELIERGYEPEEVEDED